MTNFDHNKHLDADGFIPMSNRVRVELKPGVLSPGHTKAEEDRALDRLAKDIKAFVPGAKVERCHLDDIKAKAEAKANAKRTIADVRAVTLSKMDQYESELADNLCDVAMYVDAFAMTTYEMKHQGAAEILRKVMLLGFSRVLECSDRRTVNETPN